MSGIAIKSNVDNEKKWVDAVYKNRWACINILYDNLPVILSDLIHPIIHEFSATGRNVYYDLEEEDKKLVKLIFKTTPYELETYIKPRFKDFVQLYLIKKEGKTNIDDINKNIMFQDYYIIPFSYVLGFEKVEYHTDILFLSTKIISGLIIEREDLWTTEYAVEKSIPFHISFLQGTGFSKEEAVDFFEWILSTMLDSIRSLNGVQDIVDWKRVFLIGVHNNFIQQQEAFVGYINYLWVSFSDNEIYDEDWLNIWREQCLKSGVEIKNLVEDESNQELKLEKDFKNLQEQKKWWMCCSIVRTINSQLGLDFLLEYNLLYSLQQGLKNS